MNRARRLAAPIVVYLVCTAVYLVVAGRSRLTHPSTDNHFAVQAHAWIEGRLHVGVERAPGDNDWARYGGKWWMSFPPFPSVVIAPVVAVSGLRTWDRLVWTLLAGAAPALLFALLRQLRESGRSARSLREDVFLVVLFAFGSVYFFTAVQGTVWFAAHVVGSILLVLYVWASLDAAHPVLAGICLGLAFATRTPMLFAFPLFVIEALSKHRKPSTSPSEEPSPDRGWPRRLAAFVGGADFAAVARSLALFALPVTVIGGLVAWHNAARFDSAFEFGHRYLDIRWRPRMDRWGLMNYHYLGRNLAVVLALVPWLQKTAPYVRISRHGLALWVTTPHYALTLWPRATSARYVALLLTAIVVSVPSLLYQNTGWIQFGYRFSLDYSILLFVALAIGGRRFGIGSWTLLVLAVAINAFGAVTFDRVWQFYDGDATQNVLFQPD
ncbi:MAG: hypothetical protein IT379_10255 [Deltaproteobacteria bacterium]|nr:hypothetical protein [Deltaproteobacteria bacterium]